MKTFKIFSWRIANELFNLGFKPVGKALNHRDPTKTVILFNDTPELRAALENLTKK